MRMDARETYASAEAAGKAFDRARPTPSPAGQACACSAPPLDCVS
jgi:hypothetical protein